MSDLIDRQATLKHIEKIRQDALMDALMMDDIRESRIIMLSMYLLEKAVRNQPSAQPEQQTEVEDILQYLDEYLHPIVSPEH